MADLLEIYFHPAFIALADQFNRSLTQELLGNTEAGVTRRIFALLFEAYAEILAKPDNKRAIMELYFKLPERDVIALDAFQSWSESCQSATSNTSSEPNVDIDDAIITSLSLEKTEILDSIPAPKYEGLFTGSNFDMLMKVTPDANDKAVQIRLGIDLYNRLQRHYLVYGIKLASKTDKFGFNEYLANIAVLARKLLVLLQQPSVADVEQAKTELKSFNEAYCYHIPHTQQPMLALFEMLGIEISRKITKEGGADSQVRLFADASSSRTAALSTEVNSGRCSPAPKTDASKVKARNSLSCSC